MIQLLSLLVVRTGSLQSVRQSLSAMPEIQQIYFITGTFDLALVIELPDGQAAQDLFSLRIEKIPGIVSSQTHLVLERTSPSA